MAIVTVVIKKSGNLSYIPNNKVRHGDTVRFWIDTSSGVTSAVVQPPACLDDTASISLDNSSSLKETKDDAVSESAAVGTYSFTVDVSPSSGSSRLGSELETKNGNLDVTTDPPEL
ncbi:hypothetical protein HV824_21920 [Myxococcus sp. AM009]|uniref:hypothetical protein n=1 Tax=unclassified Myxococcus TaxID=2648731 RepID=UPI0015954C19|nr:MULTISPECIES: hypothetical protein [unclassified Myxococcus]NVJ00757.1 hypothetical protein [Myxococcus sp. AM009]NVJ18478.1 hypothetical protein [Myxococcus sp. AM010]